MKAKTITGRILIVMGAMLLAAALLLAVYNYYHEGQSRDTMDKVLVRLEQEIPDQPAETSPFDVFSQEGYDLTEKDKTDSGELTETAEDEGFELDGRYYIGVITLPTLDQKFPVIKSWSYADMNIAPCRYDGARISRDLIICGHNYKGFFDKLQNLGSGDPVIFTDMKGREFEYEVSYSELISGGDTPMMYRGAAKDWDLTLFTCTWSGYSRVTVRCVISEK